VESHILGDRWRHQVDDVVHLEPLGTKRRGRTIGGAQSSRTRTSEAGESSMRVLKSCVVFLCHSGRVSLRKAKPEE
jgi:hypothetical protein